MSLMRRDAAIARFTERAEQDATMRPVLRLVLRAARTVAKARGIHEKDVLYALVLEHVGQEH